MVKKKKTTKKRAKKKATKKKAKKKTTRKKTSREIRETKTTKQSAIARKRIKNDIDPLVEWAEELSQKLKGKEYSQEDVEKLFTLTSTAWGSMTELEEFADRMD